MSKFEKIKEAVLGHHGGFAQASDAEIMTLWNSLGKATQEKYLSDIKTERKGNNATGNTAKRDIQGGA